MSLARACVLALGLFLTASPAGAAGRLGDAAAPPGFAGRYGYDEAVGHMAMEYRLVIRPDGKAGTLEVDGFQTLDRWALDVRTRGARADVYLRAYAPGNMGTAHKPGEHLFALERTPKGLVTRWDGLRPAFARSTGGFVRE